MNISSGLGSSDPVCKCELGGQAIVITEGKTKIERKRLHTTVCWSEELKEIIIIFFIFNPISKWIFGKWTPFYSEVNFLS